MTSLTMSGSLADHPILPAQGQCFCNTYSRCIQPFCFNFVFREHANPEHEALDTWNPMSEDYESKAFNSYKEPSVTDFVASFRARYVFNPETF